MLKYIIYDFGNAHNTNSAELIQDAFTLHLH